MYGYKADSEVAGAGAGAVRGVFLAVILKNVGLFLLTILRVVNRSYHPHPAFLLVRCMGGALAPSLNEIDLNKIRCKQVMSKSVDPLMNM